MVACTPLCMLTVAVTDDRRFSDRSWMTTSKKAGPKLRGHLRHFQGLHFWDGPLSTIPQPDRSPDGRPQA